MLAPAGFGKTILMSQWAANSGRPMAWATVTESDADPVVLMSTLLAALSTSGAGVVPPDGALTADEPAFSRRVLPQFQRSVEQLDRPVTLVVDDVHAMAGVRAAVVLSAVLESLPAGSQLALVGRSRPDLPVALWRSQGRVRELGPEELSFDADEVRALLAALSIEEPTAALVEEILDATRGWPVAVYLQGLATTRGHQPPGPAFPRLTDYLDGVVMAGAAPELVEFLTRSSILATLSAPYCDYVLGVSDSRSLLRSAEGATLLVSRLDGAEGYFRLHPLLREHLARELVESDPIAAMALHARAARWCDDQGYVEDAMAHAALVPVTLTSSGPWSGQRAPGALILGRYSSVHGWLARVDESAVAQSPALSITAAFSALLRADGAAASRWAQVTTDLLGHRLEGPP